jgi:type IV secretory pathway VirB3-like protein
MVEGLSNNFRQDLCLLALTRPALTWGVPFEALALNVMVTFAAGLELSAPTVWRSPILVGVAAVPVHMVLRRLTSWDYHWFRTVRLWALTVRIGSATLESLLTQPARSGREVASSG